MNRSLSLPGAIEIHDRLLQVSDLVPETVILTRLELKLLLDVLHALIHLLESELVHLDVVVHVLVLFPKLLNLLFPHIDLVLVLLHLLARLLVHLALVAGHVVEFLPQLLNVLGLGVIDVGLPRKLLLSRLDVRLSILILLGELLVAFAALRELDLDVLEGVLELPVLDF